MPNKRSGGSPAVFQQAAKFLGVSVLAGAVLAGVALPVTGGLGLAAKGTVESFDEIPADFKRPPLNQKTRILDAEGGLIADVYSRNRTVVPLEKISPLMRKAIIAIEDSRFYEHGAVDLKGLLRALNRNARAGEIAQGGSTLTQQYVKNVFVEQAGDDPEKVAEAIRQTIGRKIRELKYAIKIEEELTKDQILENYLNITFFGQQAYGVEAAAQRYFSKSAANLELPEAALLAGLVQSPSAYDPVRHPKTALKRRNVVLERMAAVGAVGREEAEEAKRTDLGLDVSEPRNGCITASDGAGFFCDYVREVFLSDPAFGKTPEIRRKRWNRGGLTIRTTLSPKAQRAAAEAAKSRVYEDDPVAASVVQVEPGTGRILAMAQSRPYGLDPNEHQTTINLAVDHGMGGSTHGFQVGSTFKPITAAAALENGISPAQTYTTGNEIVLNERDFTTCEGEPTGHRPWRVPNELESEEGTWDMTSALGKSINTYFAKLEQQVGLCETVTMAERMGLHTGQGEPIGQVASATLGVATVSPLTMATAYATFASRGVHCEAVAIEAVTDAEGRELPVPEPTCERAMSERTADTVNQMLEGVVEDGTGTRAGLSDRDNAGKTGTTDGRKDAWFVGYTPNLSTAVWVGDDVGERSEMYDITIGGQYYAKMCGGCLPGPIWRTAMTGALAGEPVESFVPVRVPRGGEEEEEDGGPPEDERPGSPWPDVTLPPDLIGGAGSGGTTGGDTGGTTGGWETGGTDGGGTGDWSAGGTDGSSTPEYSPTPSPTPEDSGSGNGNGNGNNGNGGSNTG